MLILAISSGIALMVYANETANGTTTESDNVLNYGGCPGGRHGFKGRGFGWGGGSITVSQEYKDNVINIAKNDSDVQNLLANGYNVTGVRSVISTTVEGDGTVTLKATTAIVMLSQNTTGRAFVTVNVKEAKATQIVILTRTIIEKP
jgi:hypothetical protein